MEIERNARGMPTMCHIAMLAPTLLFLPFIAGAALGQAKGSEPRLVVVLYPESSDGSPGNALVDRGIRSTFGSGSLERVEIHNEYLDVSRSPDSAYQADQARFLSRKYSGRKIDLVIAGLASGLDYASKYRDEAFPNAPIVFCAVDQKEVETRQLAPDVVGVPIKMDLAASLGLALGSLPNTQRVFVVVGKSKFDNDWEAESRERFHAFADKVELVYLAGLPMAQLLEQVGKLPENSLIYYLHVFEDGDGNVHMPADVVERLAAAANAPMFSHVDSYIGRGIVGGRVFSFEAEGRHAAQLGLRILAGEKPERIGIQPASENAYVFDGRQLDRWGISETSLPEGSAVRYKERNLWDRFKWQIATVIAVGVIQGLLITGLILQRYRRERAEKNLRDSQKELQELTGRLLGAQEAERRRIARELHDDFGQTLALLSVELDLLNQRQPSASAQLTPRIEAMSEKVKQLSSSIHDLSHQLHPMKLEQLGLVAAVRGLCKELAQCHRLNIQFVHDNVPKVFPKAIALCLYRVAQEGLQNVIKHSRARHAAVELCGFDDAICLRIKDDGLGFDQSLLANREGLGLASMRERMRLVGGEVAIENLGGGGMQINARIPLRISNPPQREFQGGLTEALSAQ
jgi:signal transduction histidine kinase